LPLVFAGRALIPVIACEIEFYLHGASTAGVEPLFRDLRVACQANTIGIYHIEKERGAEQYEVALTPVRGVEEASHQSVWLKSWLAEKSIHYGLKVDFSAKPFADQPGSGLHIHLHLEDESGQNVYTKDDTKMSDALRWSIGGLLAKLPADMAIFAPSENSYLRFHHAGDHTPTTISWGANNRTCSIRLPDGRRHFKHIEHRVAGADADPKLVIEAIVAAVACGLEQQLDPGPQIYGDARLPMYGLPSLLK
jgi:glutamine synthetase